jgi:ribosomal-protein-serine acetyltransferase
MPDPIRPTLIAIPDELRGRRVLLRPYRASDAEQVFAAIDESREHLEPWMPWVDEHATVDDTRDFCIRSASHWLLRSELPLGIFHAAGKRYLGSTGFHAPDWALRAFEIGYWLRATATGQGYMTEAVQLLVDCAFTALDANRVAITCEPRNEPSRRFAERAGFVLEGRLRNALAATNGAPTDMLVYSLVPDDRILSRSSGEIPPYVSSE